MSAHARRPRATAATTTHARRRAATARFKGYVIGFVLSVVLTAIPFWLVMGKVFAKPAPPRFVILGFAAVQIVVHMIYFLHMNAKVRRRLDDAGADLHLVLVVITLAGSLWVMYHLNTNMMPVHDARRCATCPERMDAAARRPRRSALAAGAGSRAALACCGLRRAGRLAGAAAGLEARPDRAGRRSACTPRPSRRRGRRHWAARRPRERRIPPRARCSGRFLHERETLVQAATELGAGYWVLTPLRTRRRLLVLVNRGFVPPRAARRATPPRPSRRRARSA